jgi:hypothetical protein
VDAELLVGVLEVVDEDGQTTGGPTTSTLTVRPSKSARGLRLEISASDPLGNERKVVRTLKL